MDGEQMTAEQKCVLYELAAVVAENDRREAEAVQGYTEQLKVIGRAQAAFANDASALEFLATLEAATQEKIADELEHSDSLREEYTQITGIEPKED